MNPHYGGTATWRGLVMVVLGHALVLGVVLANLSTAQPVIEQSAISATLLMTSQAETQVIQPATVTPPTRVTEALAAQPVLPPERTPVPPVEPPVVTAKAVPVVIPEPVKPETVVPTEPVVPARSEPTQVAAAPPTLVALGDAKPEPLLPTAAQAADLTPPLGVQDAAPNTDPDELLRYLGAMKRQLNRYKKYPSALKKAKIEGRVVLQFTIDEAGYLVASSVKQSSGHGELDEAAMRMLAKANPLPAIPAAMKRVSLSLAIPVEYSLITDR